MTERLTEEQIDIVQAELQGRLNYVAYRALRQVRGDLKVADEDAAALRGQIVELLSQRDAAREQVRALRAALPDPDKLLILAAFLDLDDAKHERRGEDVQYDLRKWADAARAALAASEQEEAK